MNIDTHNENGYEGWKDEEDEIWMVLGYDK